MAAAPAGVFALSLAASRSLAFLRRSSRFLRNSSMLLADGALRSLRGTSGGILALAALDRSIPSRRSLLTWTLIGKGPS